MRIIVVGGTGTVGQAVVRELAPRHEIVTVGKSGGDLQVDINSSDSIRSLFEQVGRFDALIAATGSAHFGPFAETSEEQHYIGIRSKLMGQVNLVRLGLDFINDNGSFTLTSGLLSYDPVRYGVSASLINGAIDSFVIAAAIELPRGIRINAVSPGVLQESLDAYGAFFRGYEPVPAARVALAYSKSVEGAHTGQVFRVL